VSVLLPVRDAETTLRECLDSLSRQTLSDHEVLAVDDGSRDGTGSLLRSHAEQDRRFRILPTPPRGVVASLHLALAAASGRLVARMDADDVAESDRLERQASRLENDPGTDVLGCRVRLFGSPGHSNLGMRSYVAWLNESLTHEEIVRDIWVESPLAHPSVMMRTATLLSLGGYRGFDGPEDYDLWLRCHARRLRFAKLPEVLLSWRDAPGRLTRRDPRYSAERFRALKIEALEARLLGPAGRAVVWGAGPVGKAWARSLRSRGHEIVAFVEVDPRKIGKRIHGAPVLGVGEAGLKGPLHLAAVGQTGARERIRSASAALGLVEGLDLVAVA